MPLCIAWRRGQRCCKPTPHDRRCETHHMEASRYSMVSRLRRYAVALQLALLVEFPKEGAGGPSVGSFVSQKGYLLYYQVAVHRFQYCSVQEHISHNSLYMNGLDNLQVDPTVSTLLASAEHRIVADDMRNLGSCPKGSRYRCRKYLE